MKAEGHTPLCEDYVSFEIAKLLKEKGFDKPLNYFYNSDGRACYSSLYNWNQTTGEYPDYSRPTLQMAMKWLREVHKLYMYTAFAGMEEVWFSRIYNKDKHLKDLDDFNTYEEACEAGIRYCLEQLI